MIIGESLRMALAALWGAKLRSLLTILGVVIGVASVLAVTSLGAAFEESLTSTLETDDDPNIYVTATIGDPAQQGGPDAGQFGLIFTERDRQNLRGIDGVKTVIAGGTVAVTGLQWMDEDEYTYRSLTATFADDEVISDKSDYSSGGPFQNGSEEIVLGSNVAKKLGSPNAGDEVTLFMPDGEEKVAIIAGILKEQESDLFGNSNGVVYVPVNPYYDVIVESPTTGLDVVVYDGFNVVVHDPETIDEVKEDVENYMDRRSDASELLEDDVEILIATNRDIQASIGDAFDQATLFIAAIAGVSLLVGGIMIGTIMLITVTERTKEIGMMKAIGAYSGEIMRMFLLEAALIGLIGSLVGIGLGVLAGSILVESLFSTSDTPIDYVLPLEWVGYSVLVGVLTGVVAGWFPARRATRIQPVEALSYE